MTTVIEWKGDSVPSSGRTRTGCRGQAERAHVAEHADDLVPCRHGAVPWPKRLPIGFSPGQNFSAIAWLIRTPLVSGRRAVEHPPAQQAECRSPSGSRREKAVLDERARSASHGFPPSRVISPLLPKSVHRQVTGHADACDSAELLQPLVQLRRARDGCASLVARPDGEKSNAMT